MAASSRFATVSEDDFALKCFFFFLFFEIIVCVFILKQLFAEGEVIIGEYSPRLRLGGYSPIITSPSANNCLLKLKFFNNCCQFNVSELYLKLKGNLKMIHG